MGSVQFQTMCENQVYLLPPFRKSRTHSLPGNLKDLPTSIPVVTLIFGGFFFRIYTAVFTDHSAVVRAIKKRKLRNWPPFVVLSTGTFRLILPLFGKK